MKQTRFLYLTYAAVMLLPGSGFAANRKQTVERLTEDSDKVIIGTVISSTSRWTDDSRIHTDVVVAPDLGIKGEDDSAVVVDVPGGVVGDMW